MSVIQLPRSLHPNFSVPNRQPASKNIKVNRSDIVAAVICNEVNPLEIAQNRRGYEAKVGGAVLGSAARGSYLEFDGSQNSAVNWGPGNGKTYAIEGTQFAVFARVYFDSTSGVNFIISNSQVDYSPTYNWAMQVFDGNLYCSFGIPGGDADYSPSYSLSTGQWYDFCVGYDGVTMYVYVDGDLKGSTTANSGKTLTLHPDHNLCLMARDSDQGNLDGKIEVAVVLNSWPGDAFVKSMARDPYQVFEPLKPMFYFTNPGTGVTGALAETLADDTLTATAVVGYIGSVSETLADDTLAASGSIGVSGSVNETLADDTLAATAVIGYIGSLSETLADDTLTATAKLGYIGSVAETLADDTLAASGGVGTNGFVNETLEDDTLAASGLIGLTGYLNETLQDDTLASAGTVTGTGTATPPTFQRASVQNITIGL